VRTSRTPHGDQVHEGGIAFECELITSLIAEKGEVLARLRQIVCSDEPEASRRGAVASYSRAGSGGGSADGGLVRRLGSTVTKLEQQFGASSELSTGIDYGGADDHYYQGQLQQVSERASE
jgi:hypothetical protein